MKVLIMVTVDLPFLLILWYVLQIISELSEYMCSTSENVTVYQYLFFLK